jgi:hypothetical protein
MKKFFTSIWGIWILSTIIYVLGPGFFQDFLGVNSINSIFLFIGLFVPFGIWNTLGLASIKTFWVLPLVLVTMFMVNKKIKNINLSTAQKILMNSVVLFFLTILVDLVIWHKWCSWVTLIGGSGCGMGW